MVTERIQQAVGFFPNYEAAQAALNHLVEKGFNTNQTSIVSKDDSAAKTDSAAGINGVQKESKQGSIIAGAITGVGTGFFGGGLLGALGVRVISGASPVDNVGVIFLYALLGAVIGIVGCGLVGAVIGWALFKPPVIENSHLNEDKNFLIVVEGSQEYIRNAQSILNNWNN